jgi:pimeloyl-ACP methyl ester carboxylesterase
MSFLARCRLNWSIMPTGLHTSLALNMHPCILSVGTFSRPGVRVKVYEKVEKPTLVLYDRDPFTGFEMLPDVVARKQWTAVRVPNTCGLPHWDQPSRTFDELDAFWSANLDKHCRLPGQCSSLAA